MIIFSKMTSLQNQCSSKLICDIISQSIFKIVFNKLKVILKPILIIYDVYRYSQFLYGKNLTLRPIEKLFISLKMW